MQTMSTNHAKTILRLKNHETNWRAFIRQHKAVGVPARLHKKTGDIIAASFNSSVSNVERLEENKNNMNLNNNDNDNSIEAEKNIKDSEENIQEIKGSTSYFPSYKKIAAVAALTFATGLYFGMGYFPEGIMTL